MVLVEGHLPRSGRLRSLASLGMVPFYEAFGVKPGDRMYRADSVRVQIW